MLLNGFLSINLKNIKINSVKVKMKGFIFNSFDLDVCCQGHNPKQHSKNFSRRSLFIRKLLT